MCAHTHPNCAVHVPSPYTEEMESGAVCAAERSPPPESFIITCYVVSALVLIAFGAMAVWLSTKMPQSTKDTGVSGLASLLGLDFPSVPLLEA